MIGKVLVPPWFTPFLLLIGTACFLGGQSAPASVDRASQIIFLLPAGFKGWVCTDFEVPGAPPLPREGDALIIQARPGEVVKTSDNPIDDSRGRDYFSGQAWWEESGQRQPLPEALRTRQGVTTQRNTLAGGKVDQECAFFGSKEERGSAGDPPGFRDTTAVSAEERQILMTLYESTDGMHWKNNTGWLGPAGTECNWFGVRCQGGFYDTTTIYELYLSENNLTGSVPDAIGRLQSLDSLSIRGNHLSGTLPNALIQRWLAKKLDLVVEDSLLTNVSEIDFESAAPALLCATHRITIHSDGSAVSYEKRCRSATRSDRRTFCEVKKGRIFPQTFAKLAWLTDKNGFYDLQPTYDRPITHGQFETTRVTRDGNRYEVENYADAGPFELWVIQRALEGVISSADWESVTRLSDCPRLK